MVPVTDNLGTFPLCPDTLQYGTNLTKSDIVPLLSNLAPFSTIQGLKSPRLEHSPKTFRKKYSKRIFSRTPFLVTRSKELSKDDDPHLD